MADSKTQLESPKLQEQKTIRMLRGLQNFTEVLCFEAHLFETIN
jgi:hypothetical protein